MSAERSRLVRILKIGVVVGLVTGLLRRLRGRATPTATGRAQWLPLADPPPTERRDGPVQFTAPAPDATGSAAPDPDARWVEPVDGVCPASHPIKGNADSGIFHVPGGLSYDRTVPERCYASADDAEADGFRKAKR